MCTSSYTMLNALQHERELRLRHAVPMSHGTPPRGHRSRPRTRQTPARLMLTIRAFLA